MKDDEIVSLKKKKDHSDWKVIIFIFVFVAIANIRYLTGIKEDLGLVTAASTFLLSYWFFVGFK